jgi:nitrile hydratase subunit alpha
MLLARALRASSQRFVGVGGTHDVGGSEELQSMAVNVNDVDTCSALWQVRVHATMLLLARAKLMNVHELRAGVESLSALEQQRVCYYGKWVLSIRASMLRRGVISARDLNRFVGDPDDLWAPVNNTPRFSAGDQVRVRAEDLVRTRWKRPHIRTPGYVFGVAGQVVRYCGLQEDPEAAVSLGADDAPVPDAVPRNHMYIVRFRLADVWEQRHFDDAADDDVHVEVYEDWLTTRGGGGDDDDGRRVDAEPNVVFQPTAGCAHGAHSHSHNHDGHEHESRATVERRAAEREAEATPHQRLGEALVDVLLERGAFSADELRAGVEAIETAGQKMLGARAVARAWSDDAFKGRLLDNAGAALAEDNMAPPLPGDPLFTAVANDASTHNVIVCTLCSCYPLRLLGQSPSWYKSRAYRARMVREPRRVLASFGTTVPPEKRVRVHDSTAEIRYFVVPERPANTDHMSVDQLCSLITRDSLIGVKL